MPKAFNENLRKAIESSGEIIELCKKAMEEANDDSCRAKYAAISKDSQRHLQMLEEEVELHKEKNKWD